MLTPVFVDCETVPISADAVCPEIICLSYVEGDDLEPTLLGNHPDDGMLAWLEDLLQVGNGKGIVMHGGEYDYGCMFHTWPHLIGPIFDKLMAGECVDTLSREKLLNLSDTGNLKGMFLPDGSYRTVSYSLGALVYRYIGVSLDAVKDDIVESPRVHFQVLNGRRAADYPPLFRDYALDDVEYLRMVYNAQAHRLDNTPGCSLTTEGFQAASAFMLKLMTMHGIDIDQAYVAKMADAVAEHRSEKHLSDLYKFGMLTRALPPLPHKAQHNRMRAALMALGIDPPPKDHYAIFDWAPYEVLLRTAGVKFTQPKPSKRCMAPIKEHALKVWRKLGEIPEETATGEPSLEAEVVQRLAAHDPIFHEYAHYMELDKIATTVIPSLQHPRVFPNYNVLVETSRTSSYGNSKTQRKKGILYPSSAIQTQPGALGEVDPRRAYVPRPGTVFWDVDFEGLELGSVAQVTHDLHKAGELKEYSRHLERYNAGYNMHSFLGAQAVVAFATDGIPLEFQQACRDEGILEDLDAVYHAFMAFAGAAGEYGKFYKDSRNLAKPTGLGYPGGLGPDTMVAYAWGTYGVRLTRDQAVDFRDLWFWVYPEMKEYLKNWVNAQVDPHNCKPNGDELYAYTTPLGMVRRGAGYCSVANGKAMQSPGAEVFKAAGIQLAHACYVPGVNDTLLGCRPQMGVHDQYIGETTKDQDMWHDQVEEVSRIMIEASKVAMPDVELRTEALLTSVWSKSAQPTFDGAGRHIPWRPK